MKNSFKLFIKLIYIMQTSKQLSNITHLHATLYHFLSKKSKFKQNPKTKNI